MPAARMAGEWRRFRSAAKPQPKERGCVVLDQPQDVGSAGTLRLVSDTGALRKIVAARDDLGGY